MKTFILAITTFNRLNYLKTCLDSWCQTRSKDINWTLIVADDGSEDGTLEYLETLRIESSAVVVIKNKRIGVHQQMNTILSCLEQMDYDFCFKVDDDITFLKAGWDKLYYNTAIQTGMHHLVFCDENWCSEQFLDAKSVKEGLVGRVPILNAHGFFYTLTPQVVKAVGFMDVKSFGFRGMGHVDFTVRCARASFTSVETPWDILKSNVYISATKNDYKSVLPSASIHTYDDFKREAKERIIQDERRIFISNSKTDEQLYLVFKDEIIAALSDKVINFELEKKDVVDWYENEITKIKDWHENQYNYLPKWYLTIGKGFKIFK
jgi:glycosyltransferase involved in cell wall biosynthesis